MNHTHDNYLTGDATAPGGTGTRIIAHVCNDIGHWGKGFVLAISKRWPEPHGGVGLGVLAFTCNDLPQP